MKKIKFVSWTTFIILILIFILIYALIVPKINFPKLIPDKLFISSAKKIYSIISSYSDVEKNNYINASLKFDIIYPITYSLLLFVFASLILNKITKSKLLSKIKYLPFIALICDFTENFIFIFQINNSNKFHRFWDSVAACATNLKWISIILLTVLLFFAFIVFVFKAKKITKN